VYGDGVQVNAYGQVQAQPIAAQQQLQQQQHHPQQQQGGMPQPRPPLPPGPPPEGGGGDADMLQRRHQAVVAAQATMLRNMQQLVQSGKAPPGINANTLALMKMRMDMMASMGMAMVGLPPQALMNQMNGQNLTRNDLRVERAPPLPAATVKVADILKRPGRLKRPERIFIILRGLPGAGKTRVARTLRDIEVANGGEAPRVLSLDDYFLQEREVQKMDEDLGKEVTVSEMEYVYEADMEDVYKASVLKAFKKTIDQGLDKLIIYDAQNVRSEDFEDMWKYAKVKGYETFVMEVTASVAECAARNVHGRTRDDIALMAQDWEETPSYISKLTGLNTVLRTDDLSGSDVQEVEMDQEDDYHPGEEEGFVAAGPTPPTSGGSAGGKKASKWLDDDDEEEGEGGGGGGGGAAKSGDTGGGDQEGDNVSKSRGLEHSEATTRSCQAPLRPPPKPKGVLRKVKRYPISIIYYYYLYYTHKHIRYTYT
jgi:predicted kinase